MHRGKVSGSSNPREQNPQGPQQEGSTMAGRKSKGTTPAPEAEATTEEASGRIGIMHQKFAEYVNANTDQTVTAEQVFAVISNRVRFRQSDSYQNEVKSAKAQAALDKAAAKEQAAKERAEAKAAEKAAKAEKDAQDAMVEANEAAKAPAKKAATKAPAKKAPAKGKGKGKPAF